MELTSKMTLVNCLASNSILVLLVTVSPQNSNTKFSHKNWYANQFKIDHWVHKFNFLNSYLATYFLNNFLHSIFTLNFCLNIKKILPPNYRLILIRNHGNSKLISSFKIREKKTNHTTRLQPQFQEKIILLNIFKHYWTTKELSLI